MAGAEAGVIPPLAAEYRNLPLKEQAHAVAFCARVSRMGQPELSATILEALVRNDGNALTNALPLPP